MAGGVGATCASCRSSSTPRCSAPTSTSSSLVRAPDNAALRDVVLEQIQGVPGIKATRTWLVFDEFEGRGADWS